MKPFEVFTTGTHIDSKGKISIIKLGKDYSHGVGAVRCVKSGAITITEGIIGFRPPEYFSYATHNGSMPVNDFGGELILEERDGGLLAKYKGGFNPKYFGTGWLFKYIFRRAQKSAFDGLEEAYLASYEYSR